MAAGYRRHAIGGTGRAAGRAGLARGFRGASECMGDRGSSGPNCELRAIMARRAMSVRATYLGATTAASRRQWSSAAGLTGAGDANHLAGTPPRSALAIARGSVARNATK